MDILIVINDAPHATERPYNALRLATSLAEDPEITVRVFLLGDGTHCAVPGPAPEGGHDIEWMLRRFLAGGRTVAACGTCLDQRGIVAEALIPGIRRSTLPELNAWIKSCGRSLVF